MKDILLIGSNGYIGSALLHFLQEQVETVDICGNPNYKVDFKTISKKDINKYKTVILLAGNSSVQSCNGKAKYSFDNNVKNFIYLLDKMKKKQKLIYASSASVYGNTNNKIVDEEYSEFSNINYYDLTKYTIDCYAKLSNLNYYGLRFGTVNGKIKNSNTVRGDVIINAMIKNAIINNKISCINPDVNRAILGITDLCKAVLKITQDEDIKKSGIYNLASFNTTVGDIGRFISNKLNCEIEISNNNTNKLYDFKLNTSKFEKNFNFLFKDTIESISESILNDFENVNFVERKECLKI